MRGAAVLTGTLLLVVAQAASAVDLVDAWRAAQTNDLEFVAAASARQAGEARREQGASVWRPSVQLTGTAGRANNATTVTGAQFSAPGFGSAEGASFDTSINNGNMTRWALEARQPLVSRERDAQKRQLELSADVADLEWQAAQQALMLRTAERYFDAVLAGESLRVLRRQQAAVDRASAEVRDRFRLGDVPVTDTHEAAARAEAIKAQVLAAENELQLKQAALADATGLPATELQALAPAGAVIAQDVPPLAQWLAVAKASNLQLRAQAAGVEVTQQEAAKFSALAAPSLDLVAHVGQDRLNGSGDFGPASSSLNNAMIGVQLTLPLYTGGYRSARQDETQRLADKAATDADRTAQQVALQTRTAWLGLTVGAARAAALAESLKATLSRLDATRVGRQVGDRTTLDLLNAENDASRAELALLQARVSLLLDRLRLAALAGRLGEEHLQSVNASLQPGCKSKPVASCAQ
jgi:outer membrane protein